MKKSIFLFFAAILCAMTANAYNQSAKDLYFDNSEAKWSSCYVYIGHGSHTCCYPMTRVSGTQYLWKLAKADFNGGSSWNNATGWVVCKEKWWDKADESIDKYTWHGDKNVTQKSTSAWVDTKIYTTNGTASTKSDNHTINAYKVTSYTKADYTVTINTVEGGTLTVKDYDNNAVATGASKIHLTVLKFSATPADGYVLDGVEINDGTNTTTIAAADLATTTYTLTSAVTINPVWRATTSTVTVTATATNGTVTGGGVVEAGTSVTLTATPDAGYKFANWTVGGAEVSTANPYTFTADADVEVVANFEELPKATIYFVNNGGWSKIQAYAWGDNGSNASWAGVDITANKLAESEKIGGFDVYSYTVIQGSYKNVIFNDGSAQTQDYVWTDGNYYWHNEAEGFAGKTKAEAESALGALVNYDYYLTGSLVGGWDPKQKGIEKDGELYKATFTDLAAGTYEFKITKGDWAQQWNYSNLDKAYEEVSEGVDNESKPNGNIKIVTTAVKTITVIFDASANKISFEGLTPYVAPLTYTVTVPAGTEKCYIAGAMNGWNFQEMTATANANEFTIEIAGARETDGYKYACQASWDYVEKKEDGNDLDADRTWKANDVVAKWGVPPTYTIVGATAITGANWDLANEANKMIKDGEAYTLTKTGLKLETGDYEYKVAKNGAWGDGQYPAEGNQKVTITETAEYTIVYTYNVGTSLTAVATKTGEYTPVQTVYTVAGDAALCGTNWQADDATNDMTANGDGTYTWTKADVKLTSNVGFKVVKNHDFGNGEYPAENWNINLANYEGAAVYTVTITFTESSKDIAVTLTKTGETTPPVITYQLKGVGGWDQPGIELVQNPDPEKASEYMLTCQAISATDAIKVVRLEDGVIKDYYGNGTVKDGVEVTVNYDGDGNITLAEGTYNFYFDTNEAEKKLWIAAATDCVTEPTEKTIVEENAVCTIGRDGSLTMEGQELYVEIGEFDAENVLPEYIAVCTLLSTWDAGTCEAATATLNDNVLTLTGTFVTEESGETYKFTISGELPSGEVESQEVNVVVANLVVEYNSDSEVWVLFGTDGEYTFTLALNEEPVAEKEYTLNEDNSQVRYSRYRSFVTGSLTKQYDDTYGDMYVGQLSATFDDVPYTISLTMYNYTVVDAEPIDLFAEATYTIEDDMLTVVADWEGTPVQGILVGFENVSGQEFDEVWLSVGEGEDEFYISGSAVVTIEDGLIGIEGLFTFADEKYYNVYIWGDIPATEPTPDYTRTTTAGNFGTICLQFGSTNFKGAQFFELAGKEEGKVWLASVTELVAGTPYIFKATAAQVAVYSDGTSAATAGDHNGLYGTFENNTVVAANNDNHIIYNNAICLVAEACWVDANRAYLVMSEVPTEPVQQMPGRKYIGMDVNGENEATGVEDIFSTDAPVKVIENAQLIIIRGGEKYNVQGQKL